MKLYFSDVFAKLELERTRLEGRSGHLNLDSLARMYPEIRVVYQRLINRLTPFIGKPWTRDVQHRIAIEIVDELQEWDKEYVRCASLPWCGWWINRGWHHWCSNCTGRE